MHSLFRYPTQRGFLTRLLQGSLPLFKALDQLHLSHVVNGVVLWSIRQYQIKLSPHKGFCCAHKKLLQGASCSAFFYTNIKTDGVAPAIPALIHRLQQCKRANRILKAQRNYSKLSPNLIQTVSGQRQPQHPKRSRRRREYCDWDEGDCTGLDCALWACDCNVLDCDGFDLDCDGCDIDFCDCG